MSRPTALGAFIFAGGFTVGIKRAGFDVLAHFESGDFGVATTVRNHGDFPVFTDPKTWPVSSFADKVDFVYANPPCAPFSHAGISHQKQGQMHDWWKRDPRVSCIHQTFSLLEGLRPKVWAWESVQPAFKRGRELVDELTEVAKHKGYSASYVFLNAAHLGVPQRRRRVFIMFHNIALDWEYLKVERETTIREAWEGLDPGTDRIKLPNNFLELVGKVPPGGSPRDVWEKLNPPETRTLNKNGSVHGRPALSVYRLEWDKPSGTMIGGPHIIHPSVDRFITIKEAQVICGYPRDYEFVAGSPGAVYPQIARAVMPPVGAWLGANVARAVARNEPLATPQRWLVDLEHGKQPEVM